MNVSLKETSLEMICDIVVSGDEKTFIKTN